MTEGLWKCCYLSVLCVCTCRATRETLATARGRCCGRVGREMPTAQRNDRRAAAISARTYLIGGSLVFEGLEELALLERGEQTLLVAELEEYVAPVTNERRPGRFQQRLRLGTRTSRQELWSVP